MKNGLFNIIRGIAFCFILSIVFLFGRVETKADTVNEHDVFQAFSISCENEIEPSDDVLNRIKTYTNYTYWISFSYVEKGITYLCIGGTNQPSYKLDPDTESWCAERGYTYLQDGFFLDGSIVKYKRTCDSAPQFLTCIPRIKYDSNGYSVFNSNSGRGYSDNSRVIATYKDVYVKKNEPQYDSTLGYLTNVKVKRASPFLLTDMSTDFTNIIDRFSWGAVTSGGSSFDGVDLRIKTFKNEDILGEVEKHINCPPDNYNFDWSNYIDLSLKDWVFGNLFRYEIYLRPTFGNKYGDYCYFNVGFPTSVNEQIEATLEPTYLTDSIEYVENVGYIDNFDDYSPPYDGTTLFVPNYVVPDKPIDDINKDLDDDNVVPPSSPSYTEIINNITIIQNGNESGDSLLDMIGDLFTFFKEFLQFLYNFINLLLTPLAFLPSWLKSLISMTIVMCLAICIIKIIRG